MHVTDIAAYILKSHGPMSARRLQGLVYYAQAWTLALNDAPLFPEPIEAWSYGPMAPELRKHHRGQYVVRDLGDHPVEEPDEETREFLEDMLDYYSPVSTTDLKLRICHEPPWAEVFQREGESVITHEAMRDYYTKQASPWRLYEPPSGAGLQ